MVNLQAYEKYISLLILILVLFVSYLIISPFLIALITSAILSYIFFPLHKRIEKALKRKNLSAITTTIIVILIVTIPLIFALNAITRETYLIYTVSREKIASGKVIESECSNGLVCSAANQIKIVLSDPRVKYYLEEGIKKVSTYIMDNASKIPSKLATIALNLFIIIFSMFFMLRDGEEIMQKIKSKIPIKKKYQNKIIQRFGDVTYGVIYGSIITAIIQGIVGAFGFFIFGVKAPLLWGAVMVIAALIPFIGTPIIWIPAALFLILSGYVTGNSIVIIKGFGLLAYGVFIISSIDNFLKPKIIGLKGRVHPLLVLLGVIGGIKLFGLIGFIIGPLILAFCVTFLNTYQEMT